MAVRNDGSLRSADVPAARTSWRGPWATLGGSEQSARLACRDDRVLGRVIRQARPPARPLPDMSHFPAEFVQILRGFGGCFCTISKVLIFPAKLLAMPRAAL